MHELSDPPAIASIHRKVLGSQLSAKEFPGPDCVLTPKLIVKASALQVKAFYHNCGGASSFGGTSILVSPPLQIFGGPAPSPRDRRPCSPARARLIPIVGCSLLSPGVRLSVHHTSVFQTAKDVVKLLSRSGSSIILVFDRAPIPNSKRKPLHRGR